MTLPEVPAARRSLVDAEVSNTAMIAAVAFGYLAGGVVGVLLVLVALWVRVRFDLRAVLMFGAVVLGLGALATLVDGAFVANPSFVNERTTAAHLTRLGIVVTGVGCILGLAEARASTPALDRPDAGRLRWRWRDALPVVVSAVVMGMMRVLVGGRTSGEVSVVIERLIEGETPGRVLAEVRAVSALARPLTTGLAAYGPASVRWVAAAGVAVAFGAVVAAVVTCRRAVSLGLVVAVGVILLGPWAEPSVALSGSCVVLGVVALKRAGSVGTFVAVAGVCAAAIAFDLGATFAVALLVFGSVVQRGTWLTRAGRLALIALPAAALTWRISSYADDRGILSDLLAEPDAISLMLPVGALAATVAALWLAGSAQDEDARTSSR